MAVNTALPIKLSDVNLEIFNDASTVGKSLTGAFSEAVGNFDPTYEGAKDRLQNFRGYEEWKVSDITFLEDNIVVGGLDGSTTGVGGLFIRNDGLRLYILEDGVDLHEYSLSVAFDLSTLTFTQTKASIGVNYTYPNNGMGLHFSSDGMKVYINEYSPATSEPSQLREHLLSVAWDISTLSTTINKTLILADVSTSDVMRDFAFSDDGTKLYYAYNESGNFDPDARTYTLSTAWDIDTAIAGSNAFISGDLSHAVAYIDYNGRDVILIFSSGAASVEQFNRTFVTASKVSEILIAGFGDVTTTGGTSIIVNLKKIADDWTLKTFNTNL